MADEIEKELRKENPEKYYSWGEEVGRLVLYDRCSDSPGSDDYGAQCSMQNCDQIGKLLSPQL